MHRTTEDGCVVDVDAEIKLRKATSADVPELLALHEAALCVLGRQHYSNRQIRSLLRHVPTLDEALISDRTYLVAHAGARLVACGGWSARTPGYEVALHLARSTDAVIRPLMIRAMYTHPDWARRGLARRILAAAEAEAMARFAQPIELDALLPGLRLYRAAGYEPLRHYELPLPDGQSVPVVQMRKHPKQIGRVARCHSERARGISAVARKGTSGRRR